jgi:transposase
MPSHSNNQNGKYARTILRWERRTSAVALVESGEVVAAVAREVGVTERVLYRWLARAREDEEFGLFPTAHTGRSPLVSEAKAFAALDWLDRRGKLSIRAAMDRIHHRHGVRYSASGIRRLIACWRERRG